MMCRKTTLFSVTAWVTLLAHVLTPPMTWAASESPDEKQETQKTPKVYLHHAEDVGQGVSSIIARRIGSVLREQLDTDKNIKLAEKYEPGNAIAGKGISEARQLYTSGIGLLNSGDFEGASTKLQKAANIFKKNLSELRDFDVLADTYANLGIAYHQTGYDFDSRKYIQRYAHLRPDAEMKTERFPEKVIEEYNEEVGRIDEAGTGTLAVTAKTEGLEVYVDGELKGKTPLKVQEVGFGYHYVSVENGHKEAKRVKVAGRGKTTTVSFDLDQAEKSQEEQIPAFYRGMRKHIRSGRFGDDLHPYLDEVANRTDADYVAWTLVTKAEDGYRTLPFVYRVETQQIRWVSGTMFNSGLNNVRSGARKLSDNVVKTVVENPDQRVVKSVDLDVEAQKDGDELKPFAQQQQNQKQKNNATQTVETETDAEDDSNLLTYLGIGGGVLVLGGLVAGGYFLFKGDDKQRANNFNAEVRW